MEVNTYKGKNKMENLIGRQIVAEVSSKTDLGYKLEFEDSELFMHNNQAMKEYSVGEDVEVFIYVDKSKREAATAETPFVTVGNCEFLEVKTITRDLGIFLDNGIVRDVLLSKNDLPKSPKFWPVVGDKMLIQLEATYTNLIAKPVSYKVAHNKLNPERRLEIQEDIEGYVIYIGHSGVNIVSTEGHSIFVHESNLKGQYRLGQSVVVNIIHVKNLNEYNGTLILDKLEAIQGDGQIVLEYMQNNGGRMNFNNKTDAKVILEIFEMSKGAFKKAISNLYKERVIDKDGDGWFIK